MYRKVERLLVDLPLLQGIVAADLALIGRPVEDRRTGEKIDLFTAITPAVSTRWCRSAAFGGACRLPQRSRWSPRERWPKSRAHPFRPAARNSERCGPR